MIEPMFGNSYRVGDLEAAARARELLLSAAGSLRSGDLRAGWSAYLLGIDALEHALDCMPLDIADEPEWPIVDTAGVGRRAAAHLERAGQMLGVGRSFRVVDDVQAAGDVLHELVT